MNILKSIITEDSLCFDIGANIGKKTELFLALGAKVVCIEPQSICINNLKQKFTNNNKVEIVNVALGEKKHKSKIFTSNAHTVSSMSKEFIDKTKQQRFKDINWNGSQDVDVTTLDDIISTFGVPKFCKIDVEGYEVEVLKGLTQPIEIISLEFTPELKEKTFECIKILNTIGNYEFNYSEGESGIYSFDEWLDEEKIINFLKQNNDFRISFGDLYAKLKNN